MSKAFTKETDNEGEDEPEAPDSLPAGMKNYITPQGLARLKDELQHLWTVERPKVVETVAWAAGNGDRSENGDYIYGKKRLREIDRRVRFLRKRLEIAHVVDPAQQTKHDQVFFGATVTYADGQDAERTVRIVGVDETHSETGTVSWISPIARALLKARVGDTVEVRTPNGPEPIEIVKIFYDRAEAKSKEAAKGA
jgi:transcription elongation factor GreB